MATFSESKGLFQNSWAYGHVIGGDSVDCEGVDGVDARASVLVAAVAV